MKKVLATALLTIALSASTLAGNIEMPGAVPPPPPPPPGQAATIDTESDLLTIFVNALQAIL